MAGKFHISDDGNPRACRAQPGKCRFGEDAPHYSSKEEASAAYETQQESQVPTTRSSSKADIELDKDLPKGAENLPKLPDGRSFVEAFNDRFGELREWQRETGEEYPRSLFKSEDSLLDDEVYAIYDEGQSLITAAQYSEATGGNVTSSDYIVQVSTHQGSKNQECYCSDDDDHEERCSYENVRRMQEHPNYISELDDEDDRTYANFYFDSGITKAQGDEHIAQKDKLLKLQAVANSLDGLKSGQITPWAALKEYKGDPQDQPQAPAANRSYRSAVTRLQSDKRYAEAASESNKAIAEVTSRIKSGTVTEKDLGQLKIYPHERKRIAENAEALVKRRAEAEKIRGMFSEAEAMPDGPIREYLVGDRGSFTYETTEQQGRRKVKVQKVGQYGSRLGRDLKEAESSLKFVENSSANDIETISKPQAENNAAIERYKETRESISELRSKAWAADWYGDAKDLPAIPKDF